MEGPVGDFTTLSKGQVIESLQIYPSILFTINRAIRDEYVWKEEIIMKSDWRNI